MLILLHGATKLIIKFDIYKYVSQKITEIDLSNYRGEELYPPTGVLITFNRAWIKSVFPVYFNPEDISGFISAIRKRIKPAEEDHKFEEKVDGLGKNDYICV